MLSEYLVILTLFNQFLILNLTMFIRYRFFAIHVVLNLNILAFFDGMAVLLELTLLLKVVLRSILRILVQNIIQTRRFRFRVPLITGISITLSNLIPFFIQLMCPFSHILPNLWRF